ncbi:MAG TPA: type VI secretion system tube protein TssD [Verrucomicrobiae bacterium]|nr:type VI secretion system tube protein TssD [Verrucomicrobiae bacterium]
MYVTNAGIGERPLAALNGSHFGENPRLTTPASTVAIYIAVEGTKQGKFKGESPVMAFKDQSRVLKFSYGVVSPRDLFTGQASGKRQHKPIVITREPGAASPQFLTALVTNEVLKPVVIKFLRGNVNTGVSEVQQIITLTNPSISDFRQYVGDDGRWLEDVAFTFQQIQIDNRPGKTTAVDSWMAGAG